MTEIQKKQVLQLRAKGVSFPKISAQTGLSVSSLKTFCSRSKAPMQCGDAPVTEPEYHVCLECGIIIPDGDKTQVKRFCCQKCYRRWYHIENRHG